VEKPREASSNEGKHHWPCYFGKTLLLGSHFTFSPWTILTQLKPHSLQRLSWPSVQRNLKRQSLAQLFETMHSNRNPLSLTHTEKPKSGIFLLKTYPHNRDSLFWTADMQGCWCITLQASLPPWSWLFIPVYVEHFSQGLFLQNNDILTISKNIKLCLKFFWTKSLEIHAHCHKTTTPLWGWLVVHQWAG
jgi:hypothetical protein